MFTDLCSDSRAVKPGDLFIALLGAGGALQAHSHILEAIQRGAAAVLADASLPVSPVYPVPVLRLGNLPQKIGYLAAHFLEYPSHSFPLIGLTGTNGKTSCAYFIAQLLARWQKRCGVIGTTGKGFLPDLEPTTHTTPDAITLQRWLAEFRLARADAVVMEVSSHALMQGRVVGAQFHTVVFTNLSRDHLDYHGDMATYEAAKQRLFTDVRYQAAVLNGDDPVGRRLSGLSRVSECYRIFYGIKEKADLQAVDVTLDAQGMRARLRSPWGEGILHTPLVGLFNLSNLLAAIAAVAIQGMPWGLILDQLPAVQSPPGRMMRLGGEQDQPLVIVDYAHTPEALETVLSFLRAHCKGMLWTIFGCGGERDRGKRALMARVAETQSDRVIVTLDNPRGEPVEQIMSDIAEGFSPSAQVLIELDRERAIQSAIAQAKRGDLILIAGKGHESYQHLAEKTIHFNDAEIAAYYLREEK